MNGLEVSMELHVPEGVPDHFEVALFQDKPSRGRQNVFLVDRWLPHKAGQVVTLLFKSRAKPLVHKRGIRSC